MSIKIMQEVWDHAPVDQGTLLVLLALADSADETSRTCYPGVTSLSKKSRLKERQVQYCLKRLRETGVVEVRRNASPLKTNLYKITDFEVWKTSRDAIIAPHGKNPDTQLLHPRDALHCVSDTHSSAPKPSVTSVKPSVYNNDDLFKANDETEKADKTLKSENRLKNEIKDGFAEFWKDIWPNHFRRKAKVDCLKVYTAACEGKHPKADKITPDDLNRCARAYVSSVRDKQFLKGTLPWLREPGWEPFLDGQVGYSEDELSKAAKSMLIDGIIPPSMLVDGKPNAKARYWLEQYGHGVMA